MKISGLFLLLAQQILLCLPLGVLSQEDDYYEILGIDEDANDHKIKSVFRRLSLKYHPDKTNGDPSARRKFNSVREAYDVLSQADLRTVYDSGGVEAVKEYEKTKGQTDPWGRPVQSFPQNDDLTAKVTVTLSDLYKGAELSHSIRRRRVCRGCKNYRPHANFPERCRKCQRCPNEHETRMVRLRNGMMMRQNVEVKSPHRCQWERKLFTVSVEKGMADGERITFKYAGHQDPGHLAGDVIILLRQKKHSLFTRRGTNLYVPLKISLREALTGVHKQLHHLDGHSVMIDSRGSGGVIAPGTKWKIMGEGFPKKNFPSEHGNLMVKFEVLFPPKLGKEQRKCVEGWSKDDDTPDNLGTVHSAEPGQQEELDTDTEFQVTFVNEGQQALDVYWDNGQDGIFNVRLFTGESANVNTYHGHKFFSTHQEDTLARNNPNQRVRQVEIDRRMNMYVVSAESGHSEL